jgi:hypothetical protein
MDRSNLSLLIMMIGHGDGWAGTTPTEIFLQIQLLDMSNSHGYLSLRIHFIDME